MVRVNEATYFDKNEIEMSIHSHYIEILKGLLLSTHSTGHFLSRPDASRILKQLCQDLKLKGKVISLDAAQSYQESYGKGKHHGTHFHH